MSELRGIAANLRAEGWDLRANALDNIADELKLLRKQNQIATQALFDVCASDWGVGHSMARPAHKAIKDLAALREDEDE